MTSTTLPFSRGTLVIPKVCYLGCQPVLMMEADFWISPRPINFSWECYVGNLIVAIMRKIVFWFCIVACSMCTHIAQSLCYMCVDTHTHTHTLILLLWGAEFISGLRGAQIVKMVKICRSCCRKSTTTFLWTTRTAPNQCQTSEQASWLGP